VRKKTKFCALKFVFFLKMILVEKNIFLHVQFRINKHYLIFINQILFFMKKNLLRIICMALVTMLCIGSAFAQDKSTSLSADHRPAHLYQNQEMKASGNLISDFASQPLSRGHIAYGYIHYPTSAQGYWKWDVDAIMSKTLITSSLPVMYGGECYNDVLYCYSDYASNPQFYKVNALTGAVIGTTPRPELGAGPVSAVSYDYSTNTMYALYQGGLHTVNLETGALSQVATFSGYSGSLLLTMAIKLDGTMYVVDIGAANLYTVNKTSGLCTLVGSTGCNIGYAQGMAFDHLDGTLYWAESESVYDNWMKINTTTGTATMIQANTFETTALHFAYNNGPGIDPCPAVTGVTATLFEANKVKVNWTAPTVTTDLTNYKVYEGSTEVATVPVGTTTWTSGALASGTYTFAVAAIYGPDCAPVKVAAAPITIATCDKKVTNVAVAYAEDCSKATITWTAPTKNRTQVLWDNTNINVPTSGNNGLISDYWSGNDNWVFVADDFDADGTWTIEKIYGNGFVSGTSATPTKMAVAIYDNAGGQPGTEIYRNNAIPITNAAEPEITLPEPFTLPGAGKYWIAIGGAFDATVTTSTEAGSYRWNTYMGNTGIGSTMMLYDKLGMFGAGAATWLAMSGLGIPQLSMYFKIEGTIGGTPAPVKYNVYRNDVKLTTTPLEDITTFDDTTFDKTQPYKWSVAVVCPTGGDGEWVGVDKNACFCPSVTSGKVEFTEAGAVLTWTAIPIATGYKVSRDGVVLGTVTEPTYTQTGIFESGVTYKWEVVTLCAGGGESIPYEISGENNIKDYTILFSIVPNPATDNITIKAGVDFNKIEVINFLGQSVITQSVVGQLVNLDVSTLTNGVYFVRLTSEKGTSVKKFVKQ